jgi:hypothetical protein
MTSSTPPSPPSPPPAASSSFVKTLVFSLALLGAGSVAWITSIGGDAGGGRHAPLPSRLRVVDTHAWISKAIREQKGWRLNAEGTGLPRLLPPPSPLPLAVSLAGGNGAVASSTGTGTPPGWVETLDPASGNNFYHNTVTGAVRWTKPGVDMWAERKDPKSNKSFYHNTETGAVQWHAPSSKPGATGVKNADNVPCCQPQPTRDPRLQCRLCAASGGSDSNDNAAAAAAATASPTTTAAAATASARPTTTSNEARCRELKAKGRVAIGTSFGDLSPDEVGEWMKLNCDPFFCQPNPMSGKGVFKCIPLPDTPATATIITTTTTTTTTPTTVQPTSQGGSGGPGGVREATKEGRCREFKAKHVTVGSSWGELSGEEITEWMKLNCDIYFCEPNPMSGKGVFKCIPLPD